MFVRRYINLGQIKIIIISILLNFFGNHLFAQCNVNKIIVDNNIGYYSKEENIFKNEKISVFFQLFVIENGQDKDLLKFGYVIRGLSIKAKSKLVLRQIEFTFDDDSHILFLANDVKTLQPSIDKYQNQGSFQLSAIEYLKFQSNTIKSIFIKGEKVNKDIVFNPYMSIIQEQANCIINKLDSWD